MKINLVLGHQLAFPPLRGGGVENLNWMLAREFARTGNDVVAYSRLFPDLLPRETDAYGIHHIRITGYDLHPNLWLDHLNALRWAGRLFRTLKPSDVTFFHTPFSFLLRRRRRLGVCTHNIHRTPKWIVRFYRGLDRVYCGSDAVVTQALLIDPKIRNLKRIYNCISISPDADPPVCRARGASDSLLFLYVGRFVPDKGILSLVKGFEASLREFPGNKLKTVGPQKSADGADGAFFEEVSNYVKSQELENFIQFLPPIFDRQVLNSLIASADVVCVPSLNGETFSMAVLEAMALGKPVLVSDFGPMPEAVEHQVTGYIAKAGDSASIAHGIGFFSKNSGSLSQLGEAGWRKAKQFFSVEGVAMEYLSDFEALISAKNGRFC